MRPGPAAGGEGSPPASGPEGGGPSHPAGRLERALSVALGAAVRVRLSRSRRHAIRCERLRTGSGPAARLAYDLRLASFFAGAGDEVVADLCSWLRHGRRRKPAHQRLMAWIDARWAELPPRQVPAWGRRTGGEHHDLAALLGELREDPGAVALAELDPWPTVGWGRWPTVPPRRGLSLGSYESERSWVKVHPVLDAPDVPAYFVRFVLAHECLHALCDQRGWDDGAHHGPRFRALEAGLPDAARADAWQAAHTNALVRRVRARLGAGRR